MNLKNFFIGTCVAFATVTSQAKESVEIKIRIDNSTNYEKLSSTVYVGKTDNVSLIMEIKAVDSTGALKSEIVGPMNVSAASTDKMTIKGDLIISEGKEGTTIVKATMTEDEMRVSSEEILRATADALKEKGKSIISQMNLKTSDGDAGFKLNVSDLVCKMATETVCSMSVEMIISAEK